MLHARTTHRGGQDALRSGSIRRRVVALACALPALSSCVLQRAPASPWADAQLDRTHGFQDAQLDRMVGEWVLEGTIGGSEVVHDVTAEWITGHQYLRIVELSREREEDGRRAYEAVVLLGWDAERARYACLWLDSTGGSGLVNGIIGYAERGGDELAFEFEFPESRFHTTFAYDRAGDAWDWRMDSEKDGALRAFARARMRRAR